MKTRNDKENNSNESIHFDADADNNCRDDAANFCRTPPRSMVKHWISSPRCLNFENIFATQQSIGGSFKILDEEIIEVPETQSSQSSAGHSRDDHDDLSAMFHIDDTDTEDMPPLRATAGADAAIDIDEIPSTPTNTNSSSTSYPTLSVPEAAASASGTPASAPYRPSPPPKRRPRSGGLLEQLNTAVRQSKSALAFWQHERRVGLLEARGSSVLRVLEMRRTWQLAAQDNSSSSGGGDGGCWIRAQPIRDGSDDDANDDDDASVILVLDGDLKLCDRLLVGSRLEVDLQAAPCLRIPLSAGTVVPVYPNVRFVRELQAQSY